ncbi:class E sortase [Jatrophihabitans telluris]|uniref:Class E sortase n=1 Tax=Jatrophihabitans telluris TaxID=2038343 RepID=A0ABY4QY27_9ACTN|nr:class E sortase [Jatrophihabitans telluris]UQX88403.1 class E sortase [Jatrophihabitans telluris]
MTTISLTKRGPRRRSRPGRGPDGGWALPVRRRPARSQARAVPLPTSLVTTFWALATVSLLSAWFVLYALVLSGLQQHRDNAVLYSQLRQGLSEATTPIGGAIAPSTPIALLQLPAAGLSSAVIVEGTDSRDLAKGIGHKRDTPLPGQAGVSVLYGRSLTFGAPFKNIHSLTAGTSFTLTTGQGSFTYHVDDVRRVGDPLPVPLAAGGSRVILQTSTGSSIAPSQPLYVDATLQGKPVASTARALSAVPSSERAFGVDRSDLAVLVFWLQGLLVAGVLIVWAALRWGSRQAWVIGVPLVVALLWGASGNVMLLLPNLI